MASHSGRVQWLLSYHVVADVLKPALFDHGPIEHFSLRPPRTGFVYFLMKAGRIVYIGQSKSLRARIAKHRVLLSGMFDDVLFVRVPVRSLCLLESQLINSVRPPLNRTMLKNRPYRAIRLHILDKRELREVAISEIARELHGSDRRPKGPDGKFTSPEKWARRQYKLRRTPATPSPAPTPEVRQ